MLSFSTLRARQKPNEVLGYSTTRSDAILLSQHLPEARGTKTIRARKEICDCEAQEKRALKVMKKNYISVLHHTCTGGSSRHLQQQPCKVGNTKQSHIP